MSTTLAFRRSERCGNVIALKYAPAIEGAYKNSKQQKIGDYDSEHLFIMAEKEL